MVNNTYTNSDLIRFIFKETSLKESRQIAAQIQQDWLLREEYGMLNEALGQLPKVQFSPRKETLRNILDFSSTAELELC